MKKKSYTKEALLVAITESTSIREVLVKLNLKPCGGNYLTFKNTVKELNIDTSHFTGKAHGKGVLNLVNHNTVPLEKVLVENSTFTSSYHLKTKLLKANLLENKCYNCSLTKWNGKYISLHLDHINGRRMDNRIENLRLLCPNCHSQTDTYAGKNKGK